MKSSFFMRRVIGPGPGILMIVLALHIWAVTASAFVSPPVVAGIFQESVIGEVTAIDIAEKLVKVRKDGGEIILVATHESTSYLRVPPGEKSLDKASKIALTDIGVGDRIFARGAMSGDKTSMVASQIIMMSKADVEQIRQREREEWARRGVAGVITALNPGSKEITVQVRGPEGMKSMIIEAGSGVRFRRYAPDSVKFSDAKPSSLEEIKTGDQVRALGKKSEDGARFTAEEIVSGSFRLVAGVVTAVDPNSNEIKIDLLGSKQSLTVLVGKDSVVRQLPSDIVDSLAQSPAAGAGGARPAGSADLQEALQGLPQLPVNRIKSGKIIVVSSTRGGDPFRLTAITVVAGLDPLLKHRLKMRESQTNLDTGLPTGVLDLGIGSP
jgi:hypothetical protein